MQIAMCHDKLSLLILNQYFGMLSVSIVSRR